jgi:hypothetical protein
MSRWQRPAQLRALLVLAVIVSSAAIIAQTSENTKLVGLDEDFAKNVKAWTTRPEFISPLVDHLPKAEGIPSPKDILGHHIGEPKKLTY